TRPIAEEICRPRRGGNGDADALPGAGLCTGIRAGAGGSRSGVLTIVSKSTGSVPNQRGCRRAAARYLRSNCTAGLRCDGEAPAVAKHLARVAIMLLPGLLLLAGCFRYTGKPNVMMWLGAAFQILVCILSFLSRKNYRQPLGPSVITLYVIALGWLWLGTAEI